MTRRVGSTERALAGLWVRSRSSPSSEPAPTVVLLHGLGETSASFREAFTEPSMIKWGLLAPDHAGYGRSPATGDDSLDDHARRLVTLLDQLELREVVLVGHSMGGDLASLLALRLEPQRCCGCVIIEGTLTTHDLFISGKAVTANKQGNFGSWFRYELPEIVRGWPVRESHARYLQALELTTPEVFLRNAFDIVQSVASTTDSPAARLEELERRGTPRLFAYGVESTDPRTQEHLAQLPKRDVQAYDDAGHWVMIDRAVDLYADLHDWITALKSGVEDHQH